MQIQLPSKTGLYKTLLGKKTCNCCSVFTGGFLLFVLLTDKQVLLPQYFPLIWIISHQIVKTRAVSNNASSRSITRMLFSAWILKKEIKGPRLG